MLLRLQLFKNKNFPFFLGGESICSTLRSRRSISISLAVIMLLSTPFYLIPSRVEADPISTALSAAKFLSEKLFRAMAAEVYLNDCTSDEPSTESFMCGALGSFSGAKEAQWRAQIKKQLSSLNEQLSTLEAGQNALGSQLQAVIQQNQALFSRVALVVPESQAQRAVNKIEVTWDDFYRPLFESIDSFDRKSILDFAHYVNSQDLPFTVSELSKILSRPGLGSRPPLIEQWLETMQENLGTNASDRAIVSAYDILELEVSTLLFRLHQGILMAQWAGEVLESECQLHPGSQSCSATSLSRKFLENKERRIVREIMGSFNRAVDYLVLAQSDPHSREPNFLPGVAPDIYRRADLLTAANLAEPGLRGRVISMGDGWDGKIRKVYTRGPRGVIKKTPESIDTIKTYGGPVDWWKGDDSYTEVSFSSQWKVYRYYTSDALSVNRSGSWEQPFLPFDSGPFSTVLIDLSTGMEASLGTKDPTMRFGSFFGIQRAGGGYALLSGNWTKGQPSQSFNSKSKRKLMERSSTADAGSDPLRAHVSWRAKAGRDRQARDLFTGSRRTEVTSDKRIVYPAGGKLSLTVVPEPDSWGQRPAAHTRTWAGGSAAVALSSVDEDKAITGARNSALSGRLALVFGPANQNNGVVVSRSQKNKSSDRVTETIVKWEGPQSATVDLKAGQAYPLTLFANLSFEVSPGGLNKTTWEQVVRGRFSNVYLSAPK